MLSAASEETHELSSDDIGKMKRRIADILHSNETVRFYTLSDVFVVQAVSYLNCVLIVL